MIRLLPFSILLPGILLFYTPKASAQTICLGNDTTVCIGEPVTIENCGGLGGSTGVIDMNAPQSYTLGDDDFTTVIPIGFTFNFYGTNYTQCIAGDNGVLSFNTGQAGGYCSWVVTPIPTGTVSSQNAILSVWQDNYMPYNGTIWTQTLGTAPNRMFVVFFDGMGLFSSSCQNPSQCFTGSIILYETTNIIETHIANKTTCSSWGSGTGTHGLSKDGSVAHPVPGRNGTIWTAQNDGKRFTPTGPNNYTITTIPFLTTIANGSNGIVWQDTDGNSYPYNNGSLGVSGSNPPVGYFLASSTCGAGIGGVSDTTWVTGVSSSVSASSTPDICSSGIGSVTATPTSGMPPYTYDWPALGANTQTVNNVYGGNYTVQMTDAMGCTSSANVFVGDTPATYDTDSTEVSCPGGSDGTATAYMVPQLGNITYQWDDPAMQTTQTAVGLSAGTYNCTVTSDIGCSNVVTVTVTEIPGMQGNFITIQDAQCNSANNGVLEVAITQGTAPYTYSWDNSSSTTPLADDLYAGMHTVTITDANNCVITMTETISEPTPLQITSITPDTQICPEDDIMLSATGTGGSTPKTFTWYDGSTVIGTGADITVDPDVTGKQYCVEFSESCGSPVATECVTITFPTPIPPMLSANQYSDCLPGEFEFTNISPNGQEIATTFFDFGDTKQAIEMGNDSTSHTYNFVGTYDIVMINTSIYGCVYADTLEDFLTVLPVPSANFYFSDNPASVFETTITAYEKGTPDVVAWEWISPGSVPTTSSVDAPTFVFPDGVEGTYPVTLIVTSYHGCTDTVTLDLVIEDDILFYAPNSFTPDGDEFNQNWNISLKGTDIYGYHMQIFNRWGEVIWESHDPEVGWDGTYNGRVVAAGTYVWRASMKNKDDDGKHEFSGSINVLK